MRSEDIYVGMSLRVTANDRPDLRGRVGTVTQMFGDPDYRAVEVQFDDGRSELFWYHGLEPTVPPLGQNAKLTRMSGTGAA